MVEELERDRVRIRIGLAMLGVVFVVALVLMAVIDDPLAKVIMLGVVVFTIGRSFVFSRSLRRDALLKG